jgi:hypothetical protein
MRLRTNIYQVRQVWLTAVQSVVELQAIRSARVIALMTAGKIDDATEILAHPVAHYLSVYGVSSSDSLTVNALAMTQELARTNSIVASVLAEITQNTKPQTVPTNPPRAPFSDGAFSDVFADSTRFSHAAGPPGV